jgi:DivIVA domain-containing protein
MAPKFPIMMRGYDIHEVDEVAAMVDDALKSTEQQIRGAAISRLRAVQFRMKLRGYSRLQVDNYIEHRILELSLPR